MKSFLPYLGYLINRKSSRPTMKKLWAILSIAKPKTQKSWEDSLGWSIITAICCHNNHTYWHSHPLSPLTNSYRNAEEYQKAFDNIKKMIPKANFLNFLKFNKTFEIYAEVSKVQLAACISQENNLLYCIAENHTLLKLNILLLKVNFCLM
jgi:hypothetical protein